MMNRISQNDPTPYEYRDLDGKPISKKRAKEIIQVAFKKTKATPDRAQPGQKKRERQARTLSTRPSEDASKRRATGPLPIGDILKDIIPEVLA